MIVCAGFVNSGTRLLHAIVKDDFGLESIHRSYPHWEELWDWRTLPDHYQWVIVHRRPDVAIRAAHKAGHPGVSEGVRRDPPASIAELTDWYEQAMRMFASIPGAHWVVYEALVAAPETQLETLARRLHAPRYAVRQIRDENRKWLHGP